MNVSHLVLLPAADCAEQHGVSKKTWVRWDRARRIPAPVRIGRVVRWDPTVLEEWRRQGCPDRNTFRRDSASTERNQK